MLRRSFWRVAGAVLSFLGLEAGGRLSRAAGPAIGDRIGTRPGPIAKDRIIFQVGPYRLIEIGEAVMDPDGSWHVMDHVDKDGIRYVFRDGKFLDEHPLPTGPGVEVTYHDRDLWRALGDDPGRAATRVEGTWHDPRVDVGDP